MAKLEENINTTRFGDEDMRQRRLHWLKSHREEYAGQYVALQRDVLVGHGRTIREAHEQAKEKGVMHRSLYE